MKKILSRFSDMIITVIVYFPNDFFEFYKYELFTFFVRTSSKKDLMTVFIILMKIRTFDHSNHRLIIINFNGLRFFSNLKPFFQLLIPIVSFPTSNVFFQSARFLFQPERHFSNLGNVTSFPSTSQVNGNVRGVVFVTNCRMKVSNQVVLARTHAEAK